MGDGVNGRTATRHDAAGASDEGSVLLLTLGYLVLAIAVLFVCVCATDLYITQKRLDALADSAALAGSDGFVLVVEATGPRAQLTDEGVAEQAVPLIDAAPFDVVLVSADAPDGASARVTLAASWRPPLIAPFVPDGVDLRATATSRTALR